MVKLLKKLTKYIKNSKKIHDRHSKFIPQLNLVYRNTQNNMAHLSNG